MDKVKYIGMDVHKEAISVAVLNSSGKLVMECTIETKGSTILGFLRGLRGSLGERQQKSIYINPMFVCFREFQSESQTRTS
jgi:hypothetical protein